MTINSNLSGLRILVVEDEPLLALDYADEFTDCGANLTVAHSLDEAMDAVAAEMPEFAVLDVNLGSDAVWPVAEALTRHKVPFFLVSGSSMSNLPAGVGPVECFEKPVGAYMIVKRSIKLLQGFDPVG